MKDNNIKNECKTCVYNDNFRYTYNSKNETCAVHKGNKVIGTQLVANIIFPKNITIEQGQEIVELIEDKVIGIVRGIDGNINSSTYSLTVGDLENE